MTPKRIILLKLQNSENLLNKISSHTANIEIRRSFNSGLTSGAGDYTHDRNGPE